MTEDEMTTPEASGESSPRFDPTERRILGTLIEKSLATPDAYPLTLNALVSGCNQKSNRNPVMALESFEIEGALTALQLKGFVKTVERIGSRTTRYAHRLDSELGMEGPELAVLAELMLRGAQTVNELKTRTARMGAGLAAEEVENVLRGRATGPRTLYRLNPRNPGERYPRWQHLLAPGDEAPPPAEPVPVPRDSDSPPIGGDALARIQALEARVTRLESELASLQGESSSRAEKTAEESGWMEVE
jgi:uncharacterized protein YceH (UPF0502 family)